MHDLAAADISTYVLMLPQQPKAATVMHASELPECSSLIRQTNATVPGPLVA